MADITMCADHECTLKSKCYRYTAARNPFRQSFFTGTVRKERAEGATEDKCDYFWENNLKKPKNKKK